MPSPRNRGVSNAAAESIVSRPAMPARTSRPKTLGKVALKPVIASTLRKARAAEGLSQPQLALQLGTQQSNVARQELDHEPHVPNVEHLLRGPSGWSLAITRIIAAHHNAQVIDQAEVVHGDNHAARMLALTVETTDVVRAFASAHADGVLCDNDLETLQREAREAVGALLELDAFCASTLTRRRAERAR